jgi:hypothetical protein
MIAILFQDGCRDIAESASSELLRTFADKVEVLLVAAETATVWPTADSWDDLLIVVFNGKDFPVSGSRFIELYLQKRADSAQLLPVATDPAFRKPPEAAAAVKALEYDISASNPTGKLVMRAGGMLGLRLQGRDSKIFISYRARDGAAIAHQLYEYLVTLGHRPFLDEAKEFDGDTKILPGKSVQKEIDDALKNANLVLLIDTPSAPDSPWIKHEVDTADALLLKILPICFRDATDSKRGPRFRSLLDLQRWIPIVMPPTTADPPLDAAQLELIVDEAEKYLCELFRRKCRVPSLVEKEFVNHGFIWKVLDKNLLMFESSKDRNARLRTTVRSHCSLFDQIYSPAIRRFDEFLKSSGRGNYSLFIYDGELLPGPQLEEIVKTHSEDVIILHHQELAALINSEFTSLGAS